VLRAEGRVRRLLDEALSLDAEVTALRAESAAFEAYWAGEAGGAIAERDGALALARRLRRLEDELERIAPAADTSPGTSPGLPPGPRGGRRALAGAARTTKPRPSSATVAHPRSRAPDPAPPSELELVVVEPEAIALKRLHRRLAFALHPDLARGEDDHARRATWMAWANEAYHRADLAALELLAARAGLGLAPAPPSEAERLGQLARREAALARATGALLRERARLLAGEPLRLREAAARREGEGGDLAAETRAAAAEVAASAISDGLARWERLAERAAVVPAAAAAESPLVRGPPARAAPERRAQTLAAALADAAAWEAALTLLAAFCEPGSPAGAGADAPGSGSPPEALASPAALAPRWDALRAGWPGGGAPALGPALARLPRGVEVGLRVAGSGLALGLQLASPVDVPALRAALAHPPVAARAREALGVLGPSMACARCRRPVFAIHHLRVAGLDEVHGLACPRCGAVLRSYVRYGEPEGLEALLPLAREVGLVEEVSATLGGRPVRFQLAAGRRAALTAGGLRRAAHALLFAAHGLPVRSTALEIRVGDEPLGARARVPASGVTIALRDGPGAAEDAAARIAASAGRRFRG
jgi:hypothetical protein